jgi:hypothetical protein
MCPPRLPDLTGRSPVKAPYSSDEKEKPAAQAGKQGVRVDANEIPGEQDQG